MKKNSKIYVAGHRGLVGLSLIRKLQDKGYNNLTFRTSKELDLRRQINTEKFFEKERPEYVFFSAGKVGGILANDTYKAEFIYDNIMIATNVIDASYRYGVKKLLNLGSSCIYPKFAPQPIKEEHLLTGSLEPTNEPYAIAKIAAIKLCRYYNEQYGTNFISIMPTNLYGPNDNFNLQTSHVLPALIRKFYLAKLLPESRFDEIIDDLNIFGNPLDNNSDINNCSSMKGALADDQLIINHLSKYGIYPDKVVLWGSGEPYREFLYVDDLADACVFLMESYDYKDIGEFVNIGTGEDIRIRELAEIIKEIIGFNGKIFWDTSKPDGQPRKILDVSKAKKQFGFKAKTNLEEGLKMTIEWYRSCHQMEKTWEVLIKQ